jgi:spermidine synthase
MKKVGEHVTIDFLGVKKDYAPEFYNKVIYKIAKKAKIEVLNIAEKIFKPQGYTCLALLAESHMSFHTFPEKGIISFDFFTCGKISPTAALDILKEEIKHERAVVRSFDRSNKGVYEDIYSTPGHKKYYVVTDALENFVSKAGQHIEILKLEEFGSALFIDSELQVAEKDEKKYSGQFVSSALNLQKDNSSAAIIGGGDGGVARELLSKGFDLIDWYELDPEVVKVCQKHLPKICGDTKANNKVKTYWGDAFESIKKVKDSKYDKIFVDLNDDQFCIDLAAKNMKGLKRILKPNGVLTAQVGCMSKKPKQVKNWLELLKNNFGNVILDEVFIPSFDCRWNFASSLNKNQS